MNCCEYCEFFSRGGYEYYGYCHSFHSIVSPDFSCNHFKLFKKKIHWMFRNEELECYFEPKEKEENENGKYLQKLN